jgi:hypothetical protein
MDTTGKSRRIRHRAILLLLTVALLNLPAIAVALHLFRDVPHGSTHAAGIHYLAEAGIASGCTPTTYCPNDDLTRAQMGSFLYRASGNAPGITPNTNAATLSAGAIVRVERTRTVARDNFNLAGAGCPERTLLVGGGGATDDRNWRMVVSAPFDERTWQVMYFRPSGVGAQATTAYALCLAVGQ